MHQTLRRRKCRRETVGGGLCLWLLGTITHYANNRANRLSAVGLPGEVCERKCEALFWFALERMGCDPGQPQLHLEGHFRTRGFATYPSTLPPKPRKTGLTGKPCVGNSGCRKTQTRDGLASGMSWTPVRNRRMVACSIVTCTLTKRRVPSLGGWMGCSSSSQANPPS
jgi:hypothetical protein